MPGIDLRGFLWTGTCFWSLSDLGFRFPCGVALFVGLKGALGHIMEDLDLVDYSSDRLESTDIWEVTGGGSLEHLVEIPRVGLAEQDPVNFKPLGLEEFSFPSSFFVSSPVAHVTAASLEDPYFQWTDGLLGPSSWSDEGVSLSQNVGLLS